MPSLQENQEQERQAKDNVKPGDKWFKLHRFDKTDEVEVTKVTKTQVTFSDGEKMSRATGKIFGHGRFYHAYYRPATDARRAEIEQMANAKKVSSDLQEAITRTQCSSSALSLDKKVELTNLLNSFFAKIGG
jgi:hypothetical protein